MSCACGCGCGTELKTEGAQFARGHHGRGVGGFAELPPQTKICEWCEREYSRAELTSRQSNKHWRQRRYCSRACQEAALAQSARAQRGAEHPSWKGDQAKPNSGRMRAWRMYVDPQPCEVCGSEKTERHHRDGNTLNNEPGNIAWLCRKHHIGVEDRNAYKRKPDTPERRARKREQAKLRTRRYRARMAARQREAHLAKQRAYNRSRPLRKRS